MAVNSSGRVAGPAPTRRASRIIGRVAITRVAITRVTISRPQRSPHHKRRHQMVPRTRPADLHLMHCELAKSLRQLLQFRRGAGRVCYRAQLVAKYPIHVRQRFLTAERAWMVRWHPMKLCGTHQIRRRIADFLHAHPAARDVREQRATAQRVVHQSPVSAHAQRVRGDGREQNLTGSADHS